LTTKQIGGNVTAKNRYESAIKRFFWKLPLPEKDSNHDLREDEMRSSDSFKIDLPRFRSATADLTAVKDGAFDFSKIRNLVTLEHVSLVKRPMWCLEGRVYGHPKLTDGDIIVTSQLLGVCNRDRLYARTLSRWYCLANDLGAEIRR
jgi:hypothetical protein